MAVLTQLQLDGSSTVYDLNDARISSTSVSTATHFLGTNSSVSAINPISAADLASVLGAKLESISQSVSADLLIGRAYGAGINVSRLNNVGDVNMIGASGPDGTKYGFLQIRSDGQLQYFNNISNVSSRWNFGYNTLQELATALKAIW